MRNNLLLAVLLGGGAQLAAQDAAEFVPSPRVRVTGAPQTQFTPSTGVARVLGDRTTQNDTVDIRVGDEIQSLPRPGVRLAGTLLAQDGDTVTIQIAGRSEPLRIPRQALARIEVSRGRESRARKALIGAGLGFGLGFALGLPCGPERDSYSFCGAGWGLLVGSMFAVPGGLVGLALPPGERWERLPTARPERARLSVVPQRRGVGVSLSVGF